MNPLPDPNDEKATSSRWSDDPDELPRLTSVEDLIQYIHVTKKAWYDHRRKDNPGYDEPVRMLFRGVRDWTYGLIPQLARGKDYEKLSEKYGETNPKWLEREVLGRFKRYAYSQLATNPRTMSNVEWLCIAQHFRLPTLLLDWTADPLVNLFFATSKVEDPTDAALYAIVLRRHSKRQKVTYRIGDREEERALYARSGPPFKYTLGRTLVVPDMSEPRVEAQSGRFVYLRPEYLAEPDIDKMLVDKEMDDPDGWSGMTPWTATVAKLFIPFEHQEHIRNTLENLQMHEARVFPSLEKYAGRLKLGHW